MRSAQFVRVTNTSHPISNYLSLHAFIKCKGTRDIVSLILDFKKEKERLIFLFRCESCIDRLFSAGPAPCPICQQVLRKNQFMSQIFEDLEVEKEVRIRKRVAKV
jgi:hypothetical protein